MTFRADLPPCDETDTLEGFIHGLHGSGPELGRSHDYRKGWLEGRSMLVEPPPAADAGARRFGPRPN